MLDAPSEGLVGIRGRCAFTLALSCCACLPSASESLTAVRRVRRNCHHFSTGRQNPSSPPAEFKIYYVNFEKNFLWGLTASFRRGESEGGYDYWNQLLESGYRDGKIPLGFLRKPNALSIGLLALGFLRETQIGSGVAELGQRGLWGLTL